MQATTFICTVALTLLVTLGAAQDYYDDPAPRRPAPRPAPAYNSQSSAPKAAPIAILKQINRHNEDGSYTYGYEGADGTFKIETKLPTGEVKGKYGYLDDVGKVRVVEYGANRYGFQPAGEGITVAPPTLVDETTNKDGTVNQEYADLGQYYEAAPAPAPRPLPRPAAPRPAPQQQPQFDFQNAPRFAPAPAPAPVRHAAPAPIPQRAQISGAAPVEIDYSAPAPRFATRPAPAPVHTFNPAPRPLPRPAPVQEDISYAEPAPQQQYRPAPAPQPQFRPAPAPQPQFRPAPAPQPHPAPRPTPQITPGRGGVLDQLARDYALPQDSAAPLHDISFGYY